MAGAVVRSERIEDVLKCQWRPLNVSVQSSHLHRPHAVHSDCCCAPTSNAFYEVEDGQQQEFLGVSSHAERVVVAEVDGHERKQTALG